MTTQLIQFDPDFRRNPKTKHFCAHCYRDIHDPSKAVAVTVDWNTWTLLEGHNREKEMPNYDKWPKEIGNEYIGATCMKKLRAGI